MAKPAQTTEYDEARSVLGMLDIVTDKDEYMEIFDLTKEDIERYKQIVKERKTITPSFIEKDVDKQKS